MKTTRQQSMPSALRIIIISINCLLVLQYMFGMILNLFSLISFDTFDIKGGVFLEKIGLALGYARTSSILALQLHWLDASLLILLSMTLIILGVKYHQKIVWIPSIILCLIFSAATVSGAAFLAYAGNNYYSFSMATAFIIASMLSVFLLFAAFSRRVSQTREKRVDEAIMVPGH